MEREVRPKIETIIRIRTAGCLCFVILAFCSTVVGCRSSNGDSVLKDKDQTKRFSIKATHITKPPVIGGIVDSVWLKCPSTSIPLSGHKSAEPRKLTMKAAFTDEKLFIVMTYPDSTPTRISYPWEYDGSTWVRRPHGDSANLLWNIDDSIRGFNDKGIGVVTVKPGPMDDPFVHLSDTFKIVESTGEKDYFAGQKADLWTWCLTPEYYGRKADDLFFAVVLGPPGVLREIRVQHDARDTGAIWTKNQIVVNGQTLPKYKYKYGLNIENTPWAYLDQVEEITDWSDFKKGDLLPDLIAVRGATWGGSRDDIDAMSILVDGKRTVEFGRKLDTGNKDDIQFDKKGVGRYTFIAMIYDAGLGYVYSPPVVLELKR